MNSSQRNCVNAVFTRKPNDVGGLCSKNAGKNNFDRFSQEMNNTNDRDSILLTGKHLSK